MSKRVLFDIGHPAHVHLFRNFIQYLLKANVEVVVATRDKEITNLLLDYYKIPYVCLSKQTYGMRNMLAELLQRDWELWKLHRKHRFNAAFGTSASIGHISAVSRMKSYNFNEDDDYIVPLYANIAYPFSTKIVVPSCLEYTKWSSKRIIHQSYHELAYLHPNNFQPDINIVRKYNLEPHKYIIARFSSLKAHHDVGVAGISEHLWEKIEQLLSGYSIVKSVEKSKTHQISPWDMHHLLAYAGMVISDSQTMSAEAAVLGVPSARINTFARRIGYLKELEFKYELTKSFLPAEQKDILSYIQNEVSSGFQVDLYQNRRSKMLEEKTDLNKWMIDFFKQEVEG